MGLRISAGQPTLAMQRKLASMTPETPSNTFRTINGALGAAQQAGAGDQKGAALSAAALIPGPVGAVAKGIDIAQGLTPETKPFQATPVGQPPGAMQRRMQSIQADPSRALDEGLSIAQTLPRDVQQQVVPQLMQAQMQNRFGKR